MNNVKEMALILDRIMRELGVDLRKRDVRSVARKNGDWQDLVSDQDLWVQEALRTRLGALLPTADFYAEEQNNSDISGLTWIVDPIDGTTNFVTSGENFAISVALYDGTEPLLGAVYDVVKDALYSAWDGQAFLDDQPLLPLVPVSLENALLDISLPSLRNLMRRTERPLYELGREVRAHRAMGCASLAICHIAAGRLHIYLSSKLRPWDYAAAGYILRCCGGEMRALFPEQPLFSNDATPIIAANQRAMAEKIIVNWFV